MTAPFVPAIKQFAIKRPVLLLLVFFLLSVLIRLPPLTRPLSKHFESNTAYIIISAEVWQQQGFTFSHGAPVHKYQGEYNIPASLYNGPVPLLYNSGAYLSLGPGSYWLPFAFFQLFHVPSSIAGIRIFNLLLQFISIMLLYYLALGFCKQKTIAITAAVIAVFCPVAMWYQGNAYCHEVIIIPMYLGLLLLLQKCWYRNQLTPAALACFGVLMYLAVLTDWLAVFVCVAFICMQVLRKSRGGAWNISLILVGSIASLLAIVTILSIYSNTVGWRELKFFIKATFLHRSMIGTGVSGAKNNLSNIFIYFLGGYGPFALGVIAAFLLKPVRQFLLTAHPALAITVIAPLLHYVVFYNFANEHDYAALKWIAIVPLAAAYTIYSLWNLKPWQKYGALILCIACNCLLFHWVNFPGAKTLKGEPYDWQQNAGAVIAANSSQHEYIFTNQQQEFKPLNWYAKRETIAVKDIVEARQILQQLAGKKAVYFDIQNFEVVKTIHFSKP